MERSNPHSIPAAWQPSQKLPASGKRPSSRPGRLFRYSLNMSEACDEQADWYEKERLHRAAESGNLEEVQALLADGFPINAFDDLSHTPLHRAAIAGNVAAVRFLLQAGADVNAHQEERIGNTVLRTVASECSLEMAKILVEAGADPTIPGWMMLTALDKSAERKKPEGKEVHRFLVAAAKRLNPNWSRWPEFCAAR